MHKQVICIKWGTKYGAEYVNRLFAMVRRNTTGDLRFTCFTDNSEGFVPAVDVQPIPDLPCALPTNTLGIWRKVSLYGPKLADLSGPVLFLDLDVIVTGSLDPFFSFGSPEDIILGRNPTNPLERLGQSSVYRMPVGKLVPLYEAFLQNPQGVADRYRFEQRFVSRASPQRIAFWPSSWVRHFKIHCLYPFPLNYFLTPRLPRDARVVIFPSGDLKQPQAIGGYWDEDLRITSRRELLRAAFDGRRKKSLFRHIRHYLKPTPWIADHWRE